MNKKELMKLQDRKEYEISDIMTTLITLHTELNEIEKDLIVNALLQLNDDQITKALDKAIKENL